MFYEIEPGSIINLARLIRARVYQGDNDSWMLRVWLADDPLPLGGDVVAVFDDRTKAEAALRQLMLAANAHERERVSRLGPQEVRIRPVGMVSIAEDGITVQNGECYSSCQVTSETKA